MLTLLFEKKKHLLVCLAACFRTISNYFYIQQYLEYNANQIESKSEANKLIRFLLDFSSEGLLSDGDWRPIDEVNGCIGLQGPFSIVSIQFI